MHNERPSGSDPEVLSRSKKITPEQLAESISSYLENAEEDSILRHHQIDVFEDLERFFENGHHRGYIELPTGTGKTVLFVELAKALLNTPEEALKPNILVVTPTQDLVLQTMGQAGTKGFGGFASELAVRPYYGQSNLQDRQEFTAADVGITTYQSFEKLRFARDFVPARELGAEAVASVYWGKVDSYAFGANQRGWSPETTRSYSQKKAQSYMKDRYRGEFTGDPMLEQFDVIFLDEAHHALPGNSAWYLVDRVLPEDKIVIGFTATPDANSERQLSKVLPEKIHSLSLGEAIDMGLLSPMAPVAIKSGMRIEGSGIHNATGEYIDDKISYLARSETRNGIVMDTAEVFAKNGVGTIISCIAGNKASHAREIAESLKERGVNATAVYSEISSEERADIFQKFENGEIDVLTFIGVLGEGWDSQRAKAIINARPTRSPIFATQRPGRVARPGGIAFTIDIQDEYEKGNPPISVADILSTEGAEYGEVFGKISEAQRTSIDALLAELAETVPTMPRISSAYRSYQEMLAAVPKLKSGKTIYNGREYATPTSASTAYTGVTADILLRAAEINGITLNQLDAEMNGLMRSAFDRAQATELLRSLPLVNPEKYHIDQDHNKWVSSTGLTTLFSKRYPEASGAIIDTAINETKDGDIEWIPVRTVTSRPGSSHIHYRTLRMYKVDQDTLRSVNASLQKYYETQVENH